MVSIFDDIWIAIVFALHKVREHVLIAPPRVAELFPDVEVFLVAANVEHIV